MYRLRTLLCISQRQRENIPPRIAGQSWPGTRFFVVVVVIPACLVCEVLVQIDRQRRKWQMIVEADWTGWSIRIQDQCAADAAGDRITQSGAHATNRTKLNGS